MDYIQRLLRPGGNPQFQPIPGSFPATEPEQSYTPDASITRTSLEKVAKTCLKVPLLLIYYALAALISLLSVLRPLNKLWSFYDRKKKKTLNHEDALSSLLENLSVEHSFLLTKNSIEETSLENSFSFASIYGTEDGTLTTHLLPSYAKLLQSTSAQGKFGIVYLHDSLLDNCGHCLGALCSEKFVNMARKYEVFIWMGDITTPEGLQVANGLKVRKLPFIGLLAPKPGYKIQVIDTLEGEHSSCSLDSFEANMAKFYPRLIELRQQRQNIELQRLIREQQDSRYQASLRQDQGNTRRREAEEADQRRQQNEVRQKQQWLSWRRKTLAQEPSSFETSCRVAIRIADVGRVVRNFDANLPIEEIYAFVELTRLGLLNDSPDANQTESRKPDYEYKYPFQLRTPVPRVDLDPQSTIKDVDEIYPSGNIVMEFITAD
ncbi:LAME_0E05380g1_1 [Lachancea meyersii CBS 8951]|uniref:LAME_0E05380g1_1 n=1 Tax=Lachancea meyersii CBS 8951 TaxID=1266667 RepID=A0A1G4JHR2_9SACH|nr:LAME_0E05380g1_1 [Lachancea meyersii CBS 8951]